MLRASKIVHCHHVMWLLLYPEMSQHLSMYMLYSLCLINRLSVPKTVNIFRKCCFPYSTPNTNLTQVFGGLHTKQLAAQKTVHWIQINKIACASVAASVQPLMHTFSFWIRQNQSAHKINLQEYKYHKVQLYRFRWT